MPAARMPRMRQKELSKLEPSGPSRLELPSYSHEILFGGPSWNRRPTLPRLPPVKDALRDHRMDAAFSIDQLRDAEVHCIARQHIGVFTGQFQAFHDKSDHFA